MITTIITNEIRYLYNPEIGMELIFCGNSTISYPLHNHVSVLTIGILLDGSIALTINQETKVYTQNQTFVIPPYVPHRILAQDTYTLLSLCIDKNRIRNYPIDILQNQITAFLMSAPNMAKINRYQIAQLLNCLTPFSNRSEWHTDSSNPLIEHLKKQLELYPERKLSVEEMAQTAFLSKYHFIRSFKAEVGLTPHQFQIQNRIRKAQRFIHQMETITEVALTTGFCDQSHFIKQFEKYVGMPPLAYKAASGRIIESSPYSDM